MKGADHGEVAWIGLFKNAALLVDCCREVSGCCAVCVCGLLHVRGSETTCWASFSMPLAMPDLRDMVSLVVSVLCCVGGCGKVIEIAGRWMCTWRREGGR